MKTDCQLLGIAETHDVSTIKSAYRRLAKAVHPDAGTESQSLRNHLLFIQVTKAYERLIKPTDQRNGRGAAQRSCICMLQDRDQLLQ
jgi:DnaJ-class molecular chaperone